MIRLSLQKLQTALATVATVDQLVLNGVTLGDAALAGYLFDLFAGAPISIASVGRTPAVAATDGGSLSITGKLTIGPMSEVAATLLFFESQYGLNSADTQLEVLITFDQRMQSLTVDRFGPPESHPDLASADVAEQRRAAFLQAVRLTDVDIAISSYDFTLATRSGDQAAFAITCSLPADPARKAIVNGINFDIAGVQLEADLLTDFLQAEASGPVWDEFTKLATGMFAATAAIQLDADTGDRVLALSHAPNPAPTIELGLGDLQVTVQTLTIHAGIDADTRVSPRIGGVVTVADEKGAGLPDLTLAVDLPMGSGRMRVDGLFEEGIGIAALERLLHIEGDAGAVGLVPPEIAKLGDLALRRFSALASLPPATASAMIEIEPPNPWSVVDGVIEVMPTVVLVADVGGGPTRFDVRIEADWTITEGDDVATLNLFADPVTGALGVALQAGETLTANSMLKQLGVIPPAMFKNLALLDCDIEGNYRNKSLSFFIDLASVLQLDVASGETLTISDLEFNGDWTASGSDWTVEAILNIGNARADVVLEDADGDVSFDAMMTMVDIGAIVAVTGYSLPGTLADFTLGNAAVHYQPGNFSFVANDSTVVEIVAGFGFSVDHISVGPDEFRIDLALELEAGSETPTAILTGDRQTNRVVDGQPAPDLWSFNINTDARTDTGPGVAIDLTKLAEGFFSLVKLDFPFPNADLKIDMIECRVELEGDSHSFAIAGALARYNADGKRDEYGALLFVARKAAGAWTYALVAEVEPDVGLGSLPVVGPRLPNSSLSLHSIIFTLASSGLDKTAASALLAAVPQGTLSASLTDALAGAPVNGEPAKRAADVLMAGDKLAVQIKGPTGVYTFAPLLSASGAPPATMPVATDDVPAAAPPAPLTAGTTIWKPVGVALGPIELDRLGMQFDAGTLTILCDARMMLGPVTIGFVGLGLRSPLTSFSPSGVLSGLSVDYRSGPVDVGGGLLRTADGQYQGQLHLTTPAVSLDLFAGYKADPESFFAYGMLRDPPLGGSPEFFVEGIAIGMGYNSRLAVPADVSGVAAFPLIRAAMPSPAAPPGGSTIDPADPTGGLSAVATVESGAGWLAGGVKFNSFGLIDSFALLAVDFGHSTRVTIMGLSRAALPPEADEPVALFEVELLAQFDPDRGTLKVDGLLTPRSYVLSRAAQMTGGFAFYTWLKDADGTQAGDFVYSMGGYHPQFRPPSHYPQPQRLTLSWQVSDDLSVKGSNYFAMTPSCLMAGTSMEANWHSGDLSAWFDADADFLLYWRPFRYLAHIDTSIGVSFRLNLLFTSVTITLHVGVGIDVHGPPFGGSAHIDLDVVSFTVSFGSDGSDAAFLDWAAFRGVFLPAAETSVSTIQPLQGMLQDRKDVPVATPRWLLRPDDMVLAINLSAPAATVRLGTHAGPADSIGGVGWNAAIGIAPMGAAPADYVSDVAVVLRRQGEHQADGDIENWDDYGGISAIPQKRAVPASIWGVASEVRPGDPNAPMLINDAMCGLQLTPVPHPVDTTGKIDLKLLRYDFEPERTVDPPPAPAAGGYAQPRVTGTVMDIGAAEPGAAAWQDFMLQSLAQPNQRRADIIDALLKREMLAPDFADPAAVSLNGFVQTPLEAWPALRKLVEAQ